MRFYLKRASAQDWSRTPVINERAAEFFGVDHFRNRDQERYVNITYPGNVESESVRIVQKQDKRIFLDKDFFEEGDIWLFERLDDNDFTLRVIKTSSDQYGNYLALLRSGFLLTDELNIREQTETHPNMNLNTILYGPPGTGKTYHTVTKSLDIIGVEYDDFDDALEKFSSELGNRIEFVSMHQSFSYEDFVQGLKPDPSDGSGLKFKYIDGVFKRICSRAEDSLTGDTGEVSDNPVTTGEVAEIAFFLSKFNGKLKTQKKGAEYLGYTSDAEAFSEIGDKIGMKASTLSNHRDKFDYMFNDRDGYTARKGWVPRNGGPELDNTDMWPYNDVYNELNSMTLEQVGDRVIEILARGDKSAVSSIEGGNFVIILDEINRCNISKVFGELITLIEDDKRLMYTVTLPSGHSFSVPPNLYLIGTMNTADKSVAMVDIALRRRFEFVGMYPKPELVSEEGGKREFMIEVNKRILEKKGLDFQIGHADFMKELSLLDTINLKTVPLLMEYFRNRVDDVKNILEPALPDNLEIDDDILKQKRIVVKAS